MPGSREESGRIDLRIGAPEPEASRHPAWRAFRAVHDSMGTLQLQEDATVAMTMRGEVVLPADRGTVWLKLNDPEILKQCIPGCQSLERTGENGFAAVAKVKVGPVSATFKGAVELTDLDPPNAYRIQGAGEGGMAGFAKGGAAVRLADVPEGGCLLSYDVEANVGGKLAQLGSRLIDGVAKKMADQFFANFAKAVGDGTAAA